MICPRELTYDHPYGPWSCRGTDIWAILTAATAGDTKQIEKLLERDPNLYRAEYWYHQPIHFAVREGHTDALDLLLRAGSRPDLAWLEGEDLLTSAIDRGHDETAERLRQALRENKRINASLGHSALHEAIDDGDPERVLELLKGNPEAIGKGDTKGAAPLHRAVATGSADMVTLLLRSGANVNVVHGNGRGDETGYPPAGQQPIDIALGQGFSDIAMLLLKHGSDYDLTLAARMGDLESVRAMLKENPARISESRPSGMRPLTGAVFSRDPSIVKALLDYGADPTLPEGSDAPLGAALHVASRLGDRRIVELLLDQGADPNSYIDAAGSATFAAANKSIRAILIKHGGALDPYDLIWLDEDEEALRMIGEDVDSAQKGCGGAFAAACTLGKHDLVRNLVGLGVRVPSVLTGCRSYLLSNPRTLAVLLESGGMDPDLPSWTHATPLHDLCSRDSRGRPRPFAVEQAELLIDSGANLVARDENYQSTPLAWAARNNLPHMVRFLLDSGAPRSLESDPKWATPLAWATKRGHTEVVEILHG